MFLTLSYFKQKIIFFILPLKFSYSMFCECSQSSCLSSGNFVDGYRLLDIRKLAYQPGEDPPPIDNCFRTFSVFVNISFVKLFTNFRNLIRYNIHIHSLHADFNMFMSKINFLLKTTCTFCHCAAAQQVSRSETRLTVHRPLP